MDKLINFLGASYPQLIVLLLIVLCAFLVLREWRLMRAELVAEIRTHVQSEVRSLTGDIAKMAEEARGRLDVLKTLQLEVQGERQKFDEQVAAVKSEIDNALAEVRSRSSEIASLAPTRRELDWIPPAILAHRAKEAHN